MGDFNIDPERDCTKRAGMLLEEWALDNDLIQKVHSITRRRIVEKGDDGTHSLQESMIDLSFTNLPLSSDTLVFNNDLSDHDMIWTRIEYVVPKKVTIKRRIRDWTHLTESNIEREADERATPTTVSELAKTQLEILDKLAPLRVAKLRSPEHIINPRVEKIRKRKVRLYKKFKKTGLTLYLAKTNDSS